FQGSAAIEGVLAVVDAAVLARVGEVQVVVVCVLLAVVAVVPAQVGPLGVPAILAVLRVVGVVVVANVRHVHRVFVHVRVGLLGGGPVGLVGLPAAPALAIGQAVPGRGALGRRGVGVELLLRRVADRVRGALEAVLGRNLLRLVPGAIGVAVAVPVGLVV